MMIYDLTCNYLTNPLGIDEPPRFAWKLGSESNGSLQASYKITLWHQDFENDCNETVAWDTGVVSSGNSIHVPYAGAPLLPRTRYTWQVEVTTSLGEKATSPRAFFETGKLSEDWSARWIGDGSMNIEQEATTLAAPRLRQTFALASPPVSARLYISGLGLYEALVNQRPVTQTLLNPMFTRYDATVLYNIYDVTSLLTEGDNAIGVTLGNGWYNCCTVDPWYTRQATWRNVPKLLCELHVVCADGSKVCVASSPQWQVGSGPITFNSIRNGEYHDARLDVPGWALPGFDSQGWASAAIMRPPGGKIRACEMEPIVTFEECPAQKKVKSPKGNWVFDLGVNIAGVARVTFRGKAGSQCQLFHNESLEEDGVSVPHQGGFIGSGEFQEARYTKKTDGPETWQPTFIYYGFQYVELIGLDYEPELEDVCGIVLHTDLKQGGDFRCSSDTLNGIMEITRRATLSNFHGLPTDCPHREKNGWIGDSAVSCEQTLLNHNPSAAYAKWMVDFQDCQKPDGQLPCVVPSTGWGYYMWNGPDYMSAYQSIVWLLYVYKGDKDIVAKHYPNLQKVCDAILHTSDNYIVAYGGGDWCPPFEGPAYFETMASFKSPKEVTDTAYFHTIALTLSRMAKVLNKTEDQLYYEKLAAEIKSAFRARHFCADTSTVAGDCQTSTGMMLFHELCEPEEKPGLLARLAEQIAEKDGHLDFGIFGARAVMQTLGQEGMAETGLLLADRQTYPSWGWWLAEGATTLWECWGGGGSHNHHMFGDVTAFFYRHLAGIQADPAYPGMKHFFLKPALQCHLTWVDCWHESMYGRINVRWKKNGSSATLEVEIPGNTTACLSLPNGWFAKEAGSASELQLESGKHKFTLSVKS